MFALGVKKYLNYIEIKYLKNWVYAVQDWTLHMSCFIIVQSNMTNIC